MGAIFLFDWHRDAYFNFLWEGGLNVGPMLFSVNGFCRGWVCSILGLHTFLTHVDIDEHFLVLTLLTTFHYWIAILWMVCRCHCTTIGIPLAYAYPWLLAVACVVARYNMSLEWHWIAWDFFLELFNPDAFLCRNFDHMMQVRFYFLHLQDFTVMDDMPALHRRDRTNQSVKWQARTFTQCQKGAWKKTFLHHFITTLLYNASLQYVPTTLLHNSPSTTRPYNTSLQHFSTTLLYNTCLQNVPTTCLYNTSLQPFSAKMLGENVLIKTTHLRKSPRRFGEQNNPPQKF